MDGSLITSSSVLEELALACRPGLLELASPLLLLLLLLSLRSAAAAGPAAPGLAALGTPDIARRYAMS